MRTILEETIPVQVDDGVTITAVIGYCDDAKTDDIVVIFPPHPALGGDSDNNIVRAVYQGFAQAGKVAVRFDYRGVKSSTGGTHSTHMLAYWDVLERSRDYSIIVQDTETVIEAVRLTVNPTSRLLFVAYSFGNVIALELMGRMNVKKLFGISPPIGAYEFEPYFLEKRERSFAIAAHDMFCDKGRMQELAERFDFPLVLIDAEDHFFRGCEDVLFNRAVEHLGLQ